MMTDRSGAGAATRRPAAEREELAYAAHVQATRAVLETARQHGGHIIARPVVDGEPALGCVPDTEPAAGLVAARAVELAVRGLTRRYIQAARGAGQGWHEIGAALGLIVGGEDPGETLAEAAFSYAAGPPGTEHAARYGRSVAWHCPACGGSITDRGPSGGPRDDEAGHVGDCARLTAEAAAWDAQRRESGAAARLPLDRRHDHHDDNT